MLTTLLLAVAALACSCTRQAAPEPDPAPPASPSAAAAGSTSYNLILISMNNVGTQHMSLYGYDRPTTPHLDAFARHALVFEEMFTPCSWTMPAATSVMTSLQPYSHRVMDRWGNNTLNEGIPVLPEILKRAGYATAAFTGGLDYRPTLGHLRGVTDASFNLDFTEFSVSLKQAKRWLARNGEKKFCLIVQGYDAHAPFQPPAPYKGTFSGGMQNVRVSNLAALRGYKTGNKYVAHYIWQESNPLAAGRMAKDIPPEKRTVILTQADIDYLSALYDETILAADARVGEFLDGIDPEIMARTIVVIFSEHGEMFGRHGRFGRAGTVRGNLYDDVTHVPLIIRVPSGLAGRIRGLGQLIDIAPTVLELLGVQPPPEFQGQSLMPLVDGAGEINAYVMGGAKYNMGDKRRQSKWFSDGSINEFVRDRKWKLIREKLFKKNQKDGSWQPYQETYELYDMVNDPDESKDVSAANPEVVTDLNTRLQQFRRDASRLLQDKPPSNADFPLDYEEKARYHGYW